MAQIPSATFHCFPFSQALTAALSPKTFRRSRRSCTPCRAWQAPCQDWAPARDDSCRVQARSMQASWRMAIGGIVHVIPKSTHFLWNICIWSIKYYGVSYPYVGNFCMTLYFTQSHYKYIYIHIIVYGVSNTVHQLPFSWHIQVGTECWEERFVSSKMSLPLSPQGQLSQGPTEPAWISQPWWGSEKACFFSMCLSTNMVISDDFSRPSRWVENKHIKHEF